MRLNYYNIIVFESSSALNTNYSLLNDLGKKLDMTCLMYKIKPEELYMLSFEKGRGQKPRPFSKLRM